MPARRTSRLLVGSAVATALTSAALVAIGAAPGAATPAESAYDCTFPLFDELEVPVTLDVPELPQELTVGIPVPDGAWDVEGGLVLPDLVLTLLQGTLGGVSADTEDLALMLGELPVPVDLTSPLDALPTGDIDMVLDGVNRQFVPQDVGTQWLTLPERFDLTVLGVAGIPLLSVPCELWDGAVVIGEVDVVKQTATMDARAVKKKVKQGKRAKVLVSVVNQLGRGATGDVLATLDGRTVGRTTLQKGMSRIKISGLAVGRHRLKLTYLGSDTVAKSTRNVTVKVVRPN